MLTHGSLFSGIGGFDLGFERAGIKTLWQVEISPFCRKILRKNFPVSGLLEDVKEVGRHNLSSVDILSAGFPCQDISVASKEKLGLKGARSGLWYETSRIIGELRPRYVVIENVAQLLKNGLETVLEDLSKNGYDAEWDILRASDFGAPHKRRRLFILAYPNAVNGEARLGVKQDRSETIFAGRARECFPIWLQTTDQFIGMDDGLPSKIYEPRVSSLGNAVIPQIAEWLGKKIIEDAQKTC